MSMNSRSGKDLALFVFLALIFLLLALMFQDEVLEYKCNVQVRFYAGLATLYLAFLHEYHLILFYN